MLSNPTSRRAYTAAWTAAGVARRSSTESRCGRKLCAPTEERVDVGSVLGAPADERDEVAVPAAVGAERQVDVQVPHASADGAGAHRRGSWPRLSTARKASCGTSTIPTCFIRFLPAFCFSSSFRLRVMSPP